MKVLSLVGIMCVAVTSMAVAQMLLPGDGVAIEVKPQLVEGVVHTNAVVLADTNALASMVAEEKTLLADAKNITVQLTSISYPLREYRQRMMAQDKELMVMARDIAKMQQDLEAKLAEKYPDIGAKTKERDALTRRYSDVNFKLREIHKKIDAMQKAIQRDAADKKMAK